MPDCPATLGFILPHVAEVFRNLPNWTLDDSSRTLLLEGPDAASRSTTIASTARAMQATGHFDVLKKWRDELYPVYGPGGEVLFTVERAASPLFGVVTYGVHLTAYVRGRDAEGNEELKFWIPRRARSKQTFGGMLDNAVAGGIAAGEAQFECLVREASEEASLPEQLVTDRAKPAGTVSYFYVRGESAGGETGLLQPECQYVYDIELPAEVKPRPNDDEVEEFYLWDAEEVREALRRGEFKPNCALVILDFFVRHGLMHAGNEKDYVEIVSRLHRRLEFPTL